MLDLSGEKPQGLTVDEREVFLLAIEALRQYELGWKTHNTGRLNQAQALGQAILSVTKLQGWGEEPLTHYVGRKPCGCIARHWPVPEPGDELGIKSAVLFLTKAVKAGLAIDRVAAIDARIEACRCKTEEP
jgi:hypothetical protein